MNVEQFTKAYSESRNGANQFYRHSLNRNFVYSDGVQECAEAGCYWLVDIAATEIPAVLRKKGETLGTFVAEVKKGVARLTCTGSGDVKLWGRKIDYTDLPEGRWVFFIGEDSSRYTMILRSEY